MCAVPLACITWHVQRLGVGTILLGSVRDVYENHIVVSLPNSFTGTIRKADAFPDDGEDESEDSDAEDAGNVRPHCTVGAVRC